MKKMQYSFNLSSPAQPPAAAPAPAAENAGHADELVHYDYNEFQLALPADWRQDLRSEDNAFAWWSEVEHAAVNISVDFYEVPQGKWQKLAEHLLNARHEAMESLAAGRGQFEVLWRSIKPYSGGGALEISHAVSLPGHTQLYLGYVGSRKVFNFGLTCDGDRRAAVDLFDQFMATRLRVQVP